MSNYHNQLSKMKKSGSKAKRIIKMLETLNKSEPFADAVHKADTVQQRLAAVWRLVAVWRSTKKSSMKTGQTNSQ